MLFIEKEKEKEKEKCLGETVYDITPSQGTLFSRFL